MRIDLHSHSTISDGTDAPAALMAQASAAGLDVVALTDHDTFDGIDQAAAAASELGLGFVAGMEMSTEVHGHSIHLLMYGGDRGDRALSAELELIRTGRERRLPIMLERLAALNMPLGLADVEAFAEDAASVGRPHVADAMVAAGYVADRDEAFRLYIGDDGPAYADRYACPLEKALRLVTRAGGVPVIAHPWARKSRHDLPPAYVRRLAADHGLAGLEVDNPSMTDADRAELRALADELGLLATGGSDHHGAGKKGTYDLGSGLTSPEQYERLLARL